MLIDIDVSIIIPIFNGEKWIESCMNSIRNQTVLESDYKIEIIVCDDGSTDNTYNELLKWKKIFSGIGIQLIIIQQLSLGVGAAKNSAIKASNGQYICFQDVDDVMKPQRIELQLNKASLNPNAIVGCQVIRYPSDSTPRLVQWANNLSQESLKLQIYTSNGPTLLMPTWFCHKNVYNKVGGFSEEGRGTPEDLIFFYKHLDLGGELIRINEVLLVYTYHEDATTFSINRDVIWQIQLNRLQNMILSSWEQFTIWNAGKAGRRTIRSLSKESQNKVVAFCDIDRNKIGKNIELYCSSRRCVVLSIPVVHFSNAKPPFLICMKLGLTNGQFEENLLSLNLKEGKDFVILN